jgi:hypothetical protein
MSKSKPKAVVGVLLAAGLFVSGLGPLAARPRTTPAGLTLNGDTFAQLREQIRPQPGESRWMDIPWLTDVHEARKKAAAEGKPLFVYSGGGATGIGAC